LACCRENRQGLCIKTATTHLPAGEGALFYKQNLNPFAGKLDRCQGASWARTYH
jgi:hypothetical protein